MDYGVAACSIVRNPSNADRHAKGVWVSSG
jgi:hypothetical protein